MLASKIRFGPFAESTAKHDDVVPRSLGAQRGSAVDSSIEVSDPKLAGRGIGGTIEVQNDGGDRSKPVQGQTV
jgi:hypothetical protein